MGRNRKGILHSSPFFVRTILIKTLGIEYLGVNSLFTAVLQVLNLTELGFGSAAIFAMYKPIAEDDYSTVGAILFYLRKVYKYIGIIIMGIGICFIPFLKYLISDHVSVDINITILFLIYLFNTAISYFLFAHKKSLLIALQCNHMVSKVNYFVNTSLYLLQMLVLFIIPNYYIYVLLIPISTIISNMICSYIVDTKYGQWLVKTQLSPLIAKKIKAKLFPLMSSKLAGVFIHSTDTLVISSFLGLKETAIYSNYYYIITAVCSIIIVAQEAMQSGIGNALVVDSHDKIMGDFKLFGFINNWIAVVCTTCLLCLYQPFMEIWVGKNLILPFKMVILFCAYFYSIIAIRIPVIYRDAAGIWKEDMLRCYLSCLLNIILNIILVQHIGLYGAIVSSVLVGLLIDPWIAKTLYQVVFNGSSRHFYFQYLKTLIITFIIGSICFHICYITFDGIWGLLLKLIVCITLPNILLYLLYKNDEQFLCFKKWILCKWRGFKSKSGGRNQ